MNLKRKTPHSLHWGGRGTALLLSLSLCVSLLPGTVYAAGSGNANKTVFDALGFDTKAPEGYDQNEGLADSPYGKTYTTMAEVDELFTFEPKNVNSSKKDTLYYKLFGDDVETLGSVKATLDKPKGDKEFNMTGSLNGPISLQVEGNFSKSNNGQKKNVAFINISYVTRAEDDKDRPAIETNKGALVNFDLGVLDPSMKASTNNGKDVFYRASEFSPKYDENYSHAANSCDDAPIYLGNSGDATEKTYEDKATSSKEKSWEFNTAYTAQNYIELAAGDFDGDSIDEIAVYIGETNNPRVEVWKLQDQEGEGYLNPGHYTKNIMDYDQDTGKRTWQIAWTYKLNQYGTNVVPNMVSLAADDFNKDGIDDLAVSWGYFGAGTIQPSHAMIMMGADNNKMLTESFTFPLKANGTDIYRAGFTAGDVDNDGYNELVLGGSLANSDRDSRYLAIYEWNGTGFSVTAQQNFNLFEEENKVRKWQNIKDEKVYYSMPYAPANVAVGNFYGISEAPCIYLDSILIQYGNDGFDILDLLSKEVYSPTDNKLSFYYTEWGARAADLTGSGQDVLFTLANAVDTSKNNANSIHDLLRDAFSSAYQNVYALSGISFGKSNDSYTAASIYNPKYSYYSVDDNNAINPASLSFSLPNTDDDTIILKYTGKHYYTYADPEVLAVLASPPYFEDLANGDDDSQMIESATSYGTTEGSGEGSSHSNSVSVGVYTSWEKSFKIFNVELFSAEAEASINNTFTWETQKTSSLEYEVTYSTMAGMDTVVLYSMPIESYVYEATMPGGTTQAMTVNIPYEPSVQTISLEKYNAIRAGYQDVLPDVTKALTHTVGDPGSYASSLSSLPSGRGQTLVYKGDPATIGQGSQNTQEQSITMTNEQENSFNYEIAVETKAGVGAGGVTVGVTAGYSHGAGKVHISTAGSSYTGTMNGLPSQAVQYGYTFNWKLVGFLFEDKYPVVTYLVTQVGEPPLLPKNFGTNEAETTTDQITLEWDYPGNAAGFVLYRYFQSPSASGYYKIGTVDASDYTTSVNGVKHYQYVDKGLSPNQGYQYRIQTIGLSQPNTSIPSAAYSTYTKPDSKIPEVSVTNDTLAASPDTVVSTAAYITNSAELAGAQIYYQWQKKDAKGAWKDVEGQKDATIIFQYPDADAEGIYRCKVSALINQNLVTAYSPEVLVTFAQHEAEITDLKIDGNTLTATVKGKDVSTVPSGTINFLLKSAGAETTYTATLDSTGNASVTVNPTNGIYKVTAQYSGNKVFLPASYDPEKPIFYVKGVKEGSFVDVKDSYTYGDTFAFKKYTVSTENGKITAEAKDLAPNEIDWNIADADSYKGHFVNGRAGQVGTFSFKDGANTYTVTVAKKAASITGLESVTKSITDFEGDSATSDFLAELKGKLKFEGRVEDWDDLNSIDLGSLVIYDSAGKQVKTIQTPGAYTVQFENNNILNYDMTLPTAKLIVTGQAYDVKVKSESPDAYGTVSVVSPKDATSAAVGQTVIFRAVPNDGYMVKEWTWTVSGKKIEGSDGLETLSLIQTSDGLDVKVSFKVKENTLTVSTLPENVNVSVTANEGSYFKNGNAYATDYEVTFTPDKVDGWHFVGWEYHQSGQTPKYSNDDTFTVKMPNCSVHLYAKFERDTYRLTLGEHLTAYVNGEAVTDLDAITGDSDVTVKPAAGYELADGAKWLVNDKALEPQPSGDAYTFIMLADTAVSVDVKAGTYNIELVEGVTGGTVKASKTGEIEGGTEVTFTATPERGYIFKGWKDADGNIISKKAEYTFIVSGDLTLTPSFKEQEAKTIEIFAGENGDIAWAIDGVDEDTYNNNKITLYPGETLTLTAKPDSGKMVAGWTINGKYTAKTSKTMSFDYDDLKGGNEINEISVTFKPVTYFDVSIDNAVASSITVEADDKTITDFPAELPAGCKITFTYNDSESYVTAWKVNGERVQGTSKTFTIADLAENAVISCDTTDALSFFTITDTDDTNEKHYTVEISGTYEEKDTEGNKKYAKGSDVTITVRPNEGYRITDASIEDNIEDNEDVPFTEHNGIWTAVIKDLQGDMTYTVATEKIPFTITLDANGGKVSGDDSTTLTTNENGKLDSLPKATRSGYTFDGWFTAENAGKQVTTETIFTEDTTIYAHWTKNTPSGGGGGGGGGGKVTTPEQPTTPTTPTEPKDDTDNPKDPEETTKNPFLDVADGAYYADAVLWAVKNGITGGTSATTFSPDAPCTRAQAVTFLWRAAGSPAPKNTEMPFTDVSADAYYRDAVLWAVENGITSGTSENTFSPDTNCSRGQIVAFLWRSKQSPVIAAANPFVDVDADDYYHDAVLWAANEGITGGTSATTFSPDATCTRAQIVTFLYRALHK